VKTADFLNKKIGGFVRFHPDFDETSFRAPHAGHTQHRVSNNQILKAIVSSGKQNFCV
jgi:hypothetical protein